MERDREGGEIDRKERRRERYGENVMEREKER